jgi:hypothetical protein
MMTLPREMGPIPAYRNVSYKITGRRGIARSSGKLPLPIHNFPTLQYGRKTALKFMKGKRSLPDWFCGI